ncbi:MAG: class I SAM-dependent methyltransferase [Bacteroidaceae bacterium]|nr:class I SAM-dependent methyltransferase [Bacteroidaceae bacterium]
MTLDDYILAHIDPEPEYLHRLWRATNLHLNYPRMASGHLQGRLLKMLVHMARPQRVLEIGTFTGYSTLCMASALPDGAELHTIEINDEQEDFTRPWLEGSPWAKKIYFHIGDALDLLPTLGTFDFVFIDADKRHYTDYYNAVMPIVHPGAFILADNTLWDGHVVDTDAVHQTAGKDAQTQGIKAFNDLVAADSRVERVILPLRDGLTIIRKL